LDKNINNVFKIYKTICVNLDQTAIVIQDARMPTGKTPYFENRPINSPRLIDLFLTVIHTFKLPLLRSLSLYAGRPNIQVVAVRDDLHLLSAFRTDFLIWPASAFKSSPICDMSPSSLEQFTTIAT